MPLEGESCSCCQEFESPVGEFAEAFASGVGRFHLGQEGLLVGIVAEEGAEWKAVLASLAAIARDLEVVVEECVLVEVEGYHVVEEAHPDK